MYELALTIVAKIIFVAGILGLILLWIGFAFSLYWFIQYLAPAFT